MNLTFYSLLYDAYIIVSLFNIHPVVFIRQVVDFVIQTSFTHLLDINNQDKYLVNCIISRYTITLSIIVLLFAGVLSHRHQSNCRNGSKMDVSRLCTR